jgi:eukaryotic-like serine/threonine-protein kinase
VPSDWSVSRQGARVYFRDPDSFRFLIIDQTDNPKEDPVADWEQQEESRSERYPDYRRIRIEEVDYFDRAADWEFTYAGRDDRIHVLIRGVVTSDDQAYGLYWSTLDDQWRESLRLFDVFTETFRPAP